MKYTTFLSLFSGIGFLGIATGTTFGFFLPLDKVVLEWISTLYSPAAVSFFKTLTHIVSDPFIVVPMLLILLVLLVRWRREMVYIVLFSLTTTAVSLYAFKALFSTPRPSFSLIEAAGGSFPSGHATLAFLTALLSILIFNSFVHIQKARFAAGALFIILASMVSFSRLYLGVHRFSEVVAGIFLALFWVSLVLWRQQHTISH